MSPLRQLETPGYGLENWSARRSPGRTSRRHVTLRLWLPLTPLFLLLAPFALLAAPLIELAPAARRLNPWRAAWALGAVLLSLSGTLVSVENRRVNLRIQIL